MGRHLVGMAKMSRTKYKYEGRMKTASQIQVDISFLARGLYFVKVITSKSTETKKIVVE
jgi:hypothetical protein